MKTTKNLQRSLCWIKNQAEYNGGMRDVKADPCEGNNTPLWLEDEAPVPSITNTASRKCFTLITFDVTRAGETLTLRAQSGGILRITETDDVDHFVVVGVQLP
jgi:hypothetical protein